MKRLHQVLNSLKKLWTLIISRVYLAWSHIKPAMRICGSYLKKCFWLFEKMLSHRSFLKKGFKLQSFGRFFSNIAKKVLKYAKVLYVRFAKKLSSLRFRTFWLGLKRVFRFLYRFVESIFTLAFIAKVKQLFAKKEPGFIAFDGEDFGFYQGDFDDKNMQSKTYFGQKDTLKDFKAWCKKQGIKPRKYSVSSPLPDESYQIFTIPTPEVSSYELKKTVKWLLRERIAFDLNNLIIDFFYVYTKDLSLDTKKLYVVVIDKSKALKHLMWIHQRGFAIDRYGVKELMLKDRFVAPSMNKMLIVVLLDKKVPLLQILYKGRMMVCGHLPEMFQLDLNTLDIKTLAANIIETYGLQVVEYLKESLESRWLINLPKSYIPKLNKALKDQKHEQISFESFASEAQGKDAMPFEMSFLNTMLTMPETIV